MSSSHILVADDQNLIANALQMVLEGEGDRVTMAANGMKALEAEAQDPQNPLVADMMMPVMGGRELIERLRLRRPDLPVLVLTGDGEGPRWKSPTG